MSHSGNAGAARREIKLKYQMTVRYVHSYRRRLPSRKHSANGSLMMPVPILATRIMHALRLSERACYSQTM